VRRSEADPIYIRDLKLTRKIMKNSICWRSFARNRPWLATNEPSTGSKMLFLDFTTVLVPLFLLSSIRKRRRNFKQLNFRYSSASRGVSSEVLRFPELTFKISIIFKFCCKICEIEQIFRRFFKRKSTRSARRQKRLINGTISDSLRVNSVQ